MVDSNSLSIDYDTKEELKEIRVRYSTIINFLSRLYKLIISIGFTLFITRKLSVQEYGLFTTIMALISVFSSPSRFTNLWIRRFYARKKYEIVSAALCLAVLYIPLGLLLTVLSGNLFIDIHGTNIILFTIAGIVVSINVLLSTFMSILTSTKPFLDGKVRVIQETIRFISAYILVVLLTLKVLGALFSVLISFTIALLSSIYYMKKFNFRVPRPKFMFIHIKRILSNSYIPLISTISDIMLVFERPLVTLITKSTIIAAFFGVSYIPRSIIMQTGFGFTLGLSAKLLRSPSRKDTEDVIRITSILSIGLTILICIFGVSILSLFKIDYASAYLLFILFSFEALFMTYANLFATIAVSSETKDLYSFGIELRTTPLFKISFAYFIRCAVSLFIGSIASYILIISGIKDPVLIALPYPLMWMLSSIPYLIYTYKSAKEKLNFTIPWREIITTVIAGIIASIPVYLLGGIDIIIRNFWSEAFVLIRYGLIWFAIFIPTLIVLSRWTREFVKEGMKYLFKG